MTSVFCVRGCHFGRKCSDPWHPRVSIKPSKLSIALLISTVSILGRNDLQLSETLRSRVYLRRRHQQKLSVSSYNSCSFHFSPEYLMHPIGKHRSRCQNSLKIKEAFTLWVTLAASHRPVGGSNLIPQVSTEKLGIGRWPETLLEETGDERNNPCLNSRVWEPRWTRILSYTLPCFPVPSWASCPSLLPLGGCPLPLLNFVFSWLHLIALYKSTHKKNSVEREDELRNSQPTWNATVCMECAKKSFRMEQSSCNSTWRTGDVSPVGSTSYLLSSMMSL